MDFDKLISFYEKRSTAIAVFGEKPLRELRVMIVLSGYSFLEKEWVNIESEGQLSIAHYILDELINDI